MSGAGTVPCRQSSILNYRTKPTFCGREISWDNKRLCPIWTRTQASNALAMRLSRKKLRMAVFAILLLVATNSFWIGWVLLQNNADVSLSSSQVHVPHPLHHMKENRKLHHELVSSSGGKPKKHNHLKIIWNPQDRKNQANSKDTDETNEQDKEIPINPSSHQSMLNCSAYGGPYDFESVEEMVYWKDIPQDLEYKSRFTSKEPRYLTFDTDLSGFNNQRMVFEINLMTAIVTGRTLVIPQGRVVSHMEETGRFALSEFFNLSGIAQEMPNALKLMSMEDFLAKEGGIDGLHVPTNFTGFYNRTNSRVSRELLANGTTLYSVDTNNTDYHDHFLLDRIRELVCPIAKLGKDKCSKYTKWMEKRHGVFSTELNSWHLVYFLDEFLGGHPKVYSPKWGVHRCILTIPDRTVDDRFHDWIEAGFNGTNNDWKTRRLLFVGNPAEVNASPQVRLAQIYQTRQGLCVYGDDSQSQKYFHMQDRVERESRLMGHWYDYILFEDWREDLWAKRFMRDKVRYPDALQCASARIVAAMRELAAAQSSSDRFHTMHIRRTDLTKMYHVWGIDKDASEIYYEFAVKRKIIPKDSIVYIATDEKDKNFFEVFLKHYKAVYFLDDFLDLIPEVPAQHYGMIDQLVCTKGEHFVGTYYSTFTGYINRLRGYHSQKQNTTTNDGIVEQGRIPSWFYAPPERIESYQHFEPIGKGFFEMEYALAWRNIDYDVDPVLRQKVDQIVAAENT